MAVACEAPFCSTHLNLPLTENSERTLSSRWWDDADSLLPKYKAVKEAGWAGVGMWQANGMFPECDGETDPNWLNVYDAEAMQSMWAAIGAAWK